MKKLFDTKLPFYSVLAIPDIVVRLLGSSGYPPYLHLAWNRLNISKIGNLIYVPLLMVLLLCFFSCSQETEQQVVSSNSPTQILTVNPADLPPPIKARYIDPDSVAPPIVVPLKGKPKVVPAHSNVHSAGRPEVIEIPNDLKVVMLGKDVPLPTTIPAETKVVPALQPKPIPAKAFRTGDAANYTIQYLSEEQGLTQGVVLSILEDSRGHLWFGTANYGVFRYDGQNFFHYNTEEGLLAIWGVKHIVEDSKGNIWFAGKGGVCYYDGQNFVHLFQEELWQAKTSSLMEDSKGNIWFSSKDVYCYDGEKFTVFKQEHGLTNNARKDPGYYSDNRIVDMVEDKDGNFWWATQGSGVLRYDGKHITHFTEKEGLASNYIVKILEDSQGQLWFASGGEGTIGGGVSRYAPKPTSPEKTNGSFTNFSKAQGLSDNRISDMVEDQFGNIWFATYDGGMCRYDGEVFTHFTEAEGLSLEGVFCIMEDSRGNIWAGTNGNGVNRFQPGSFQYFTEKQGLSKDQVGCIIEDREGNIWMGTGGIIKYDGQNFTYYTEAEGLLQNTVNSMMVDSEDKLWIATRDKGICSFDGEVFTHYTSKQGLNAIFFWDLHEDSKGMIWIASGWADGIIRLNPKTGQITQYQGEEKDGIGGGGIFEDKQQNIWFGGRGLVAKYNPQSDGLDFTYQIDPEDKSWVDLMLEDKNENLWFGAPNIFVQVKKRGEEIKNDFPRFSKEEGLPDISINSMEEDREQNLWIGTDNDGLGVLIGGVKNFGASNFKWIQYNRSDGLKSNHYSDRSSLLDSQNRIWWGNKSGVTMLDLNIFQLPSEAPKGLDLSYLEVQGQFIDYQDLSHEETESTLAFSKNLSQSFDSIASFNNYPTNLNLPYDLNHLTFHFTTMDWAAPHKIQYSYKMEGLDKGWSQPTPEAKADYRNLPYGSFTFKVKAMGEAQVWSEPFEYTFTIRPPWWHTWWAYILYALLIFGLTGWYIQRLRWKVRQKQQQLEKEQYLNQELAEVNEANSRFVPFDFLQILGKKSLKELRLGDQTAAKMTILFADIRSYTTLSETMTPEDNFNFINGFLGRMGPIIREHGGFINQYLGDGIMALFKDNPEMAVKAAIEMQQALERYNKKRLVQNRKAVRLGIGLNTGRLMLGVIGDKGRYESSVISDAVNTASRMEGLTKIFGCSIVISEKTLAEIHLLDSKEVSDAFLDEYRYLGKVKVKGKDQALKIYDFYRGDSAHFRQMKTATKVNFERAIHYYYNKKFGKAADIFKELAKQFPEDIATEYYLEKAVEYTIKGVDANWSGIEEMVSK